ncbi:electron transfer flavoprotein subunit alpha/FixB family protein [Cellvibrio japonicus]|uniref:Electron transfer flavoprotein subunit alpha n=1 Tax=Cellvibrio japonicus (strain Ueda107) TaxID=498211 RepID=B3PLI5_CELJU|nr:FAD-binding protein [Cellvibrio japonicus]ACE84777.1 electron transfer flavoprotein FAD-binding domain [Cellvibrio japonicus Ueda107]QEI12972.1 electron transfer flavoprotein subunit alpha [Cellvibrio japonicus]QEI16546.1 electron transfer flavoprotein subunit alpha [Cellvibrio japonicus]QEI20124.1 electron transfer flavoprotein subunit alpha [Cellvibrio japonicus]
MSVLVLAEHDGKQLKSFMAQLIGAASRWNQPIDVLVYGNQVDEMAREAASLSGVARIILASAEHLAHPLVEDVQDLVLEIAREYSVILGAHSVLGKSVLPGIAARLDIAPIMDVIDISGPATYIRPEYAGNIFSQIENLQSRQIISVRTTSFKPVHGDGHADIVTLPVPRSRAISHWISDDIHHSDRPELASARVVISGGRSLGDDFERLLAPIAGQLGAAIGATRACVDAGFAPNDLQVGQTGTVIAPDLYIAVGVSGAVQHIAGIKDSKLVVAINHDPNAPIFHYADYGLVADLFTALPELQTALKERATAH